MTKSPPVISSNENEVFTSPRGIPRGWPATIGPYRLVSLLGRGGMATVFLARHAEGGPDVALKVLDPHLLGKNIHRARERFEREAEVMSRLTHPGIVNLVLKGVHQTGDSMPLLYFVMEFIDGFNAHDLLMRRGRLWLSEAVRITRDAALALEHAHGQGVVHRDIKPSNIFVDRQGRVRVGDFGVCLVADGLELTQVGHVMGTMAFLAPEQLVGERAEAPSDVFALAAVCFTLASGSLIRDARTPPWANAKETPAAHLHLIPDLPEGLRGVLERALAVDPHQRPKNAGELARLLTPFAGKMVQPVDGAPVAQAFAATEVPPNPNTPRPIPYAAAADTEALRLTLEPFDAEASTIKERSPLAVAVGATGKEVFTGPCHLLQVTGSGAGRVHRLKAGATQLGRTRDNDVVLDDLSVSVHHAVMRQEKGRYTLEDRNSTNGLRVNGIGVPQAVMHDGDAITVGLVQLRFLGDQANLKKVRQDLLGDGMLGNAVVRPSTVVPAGGLRRRHRLAGITVGDVSALVVLALLAGGVLGFVLGRW